MKTERRKAKIFSHNILAGYLTAYDDGSYGFEYVDSYQGPPISLTMSVGKKVFNFSSFPPFFEGLLPEGRRLEQLLRLCKIDRNDFFSILLETGSDLVGAVTVVKDDV